MSSQRPDLIPVPCFVFDELLHLMTSDEVKVLLYIIRRTIGHDKESDEIAVSQFLHGIKCKSGRQQDYGTGLSQLRNSQARESLIHFGVILVKQKGKGHYLKSERQTGKYALQLDLSQIDRDGMQERANQKLEADKARIAKAAASRKPRKSRSVRFLTGKNKSGISRQSIEQ